MPHNKLLVCVDRRMSVPTNKMIYFLFQLIWYFLLIYLYGLYRLIIQLFQRHNSVSGIPLQTGRVAIVTGGANGIGFYISRGLVEKNVHVIIGCKSSTEGKHAIDKIREDFPNAKVDFIKLDLASMLSVREFAEDFISRNLGLHILINNAGVMFPPYEVTIDGYESTFQVNYLAHFYLTQLLLDNLKISGVENSWSRIVNVSSAVQAMGSPNVDLIGERCTHRYKYSPHKTYADTKLMIIASSNYLNRLLQEGDCKVTVNSLHPGIVDSKLIRHLHWLIRPVIGLISRIFYLSMKQGADTPLNVALSPELEGQGGGYYDNSQEMEPACLATDKEFQESLWRKTKQILEKIDS